MRPMYFHMAYMMIQSMVSLVHLISLGPPLCLGPQQELRKLEVLIGLNLGGEDVAKE
jgi:hypothetical protein